MPKIVAPHGLWQSPFDLQLVFERPSAPLYAAHYEGSYFWIEGRAKEGGRQVLIRREPDGRESCLTPLGFNIRSRVHEYGGRCCILGNGRAYFSNLDDGRLYVQRLAENAQPEPLTVDSDGALLFSDLQLSPQNRHLIAVMETICDGRENQNRLVAVKLGAMALVEPIPVAQGADFYANPVVDKTGSRLAWIQWDHPFMPWDQTHLKLAEIVEDKAGLGIKGEESITHGQGSSVCNLGFYGSDLLFAMDREDAVEACDDFWNLYVHRNGEIIRLTCEEMEYGAPHWVFGDTSHAAVSGTAIVARRTGESGDELVEVNRISGEQRLVASDFDSINDLNPGDNEVLMTVASPTQATQLMSFGRRGFTVIKSSETPVLPEHISTGTAVRYPTRDGFWAHGYLYLPQNSAYAAPPDELPPLLVMVHGGPTARATRSLDLSRQYWTSIGFAILDVNHRGSTGYGRRYRQFLLGRWGQVDVDDIIDGIDYLADQSLVDPKNICIRGKSAGGYTVLRALTEYPRYFCAGACYYGIGNLSTLASITHKFEARYTDRLIGEDYDAVRPESVDSEYYRRSPVHFMHKVNSPMILFQGLDDRVVPASVSREVVGVLDSQGVEHEYVEYPGEGHGFRKSETSIDAIQRETRFYRRVLGLKSDQ